MKENGECRLRILGVGRRFVVRSVEKIVQRTNKTNTPVGASAGSIHQSLRHRRAEQTHLIFWFCIKHGELQRVSTGSRPPLCTAHMADRPDDDRFSHHLVCWKCNLLIGEAKKWFFFASWNYWSILFIKPRLPGISKILLIFMFWPCLCSLMCIYKSLSSFEKGHQERLCAAKAMSCACVYSLYTSPITTN